MKRRHVADYMDTKRIQIEEVVKLCSIISLTSHHFYSALITNCCCAGFTLSPQPSMFLYVHFHPLFLLFTSFLSQFFLFTQQGPLYSLGCLRIPGPACLCTVSVYMCVPVREQLSHSAITCCTAETDRYNPCQLSPSICLPFFF